MANVDVDSVADALPLALQKVFANVFGKGDGSDGPTSFTAGSNAPPAPPPDASPEAQPASMGGDFYSGANSAPSAPASANAQPAAPQMGSIPGTDNWMSIIGGKSAQPAQPQQPAQATATGQTAPPGLTKMQKLGMILKDGLLGAAAGRAANEEAIVQSGGHRSGGAGIGFMAGLQAPQQQQAAQLNLQKEQAQTDLIKSQAEMIDTPMGKMPAGLAKAMFPAIIQGQTAKTVQGMKGATAEDIQGQKSDTSESNAQTRATAATQGHRYVPVPGVGLFDTQQRSVVPGTASGITVTPEIAQDHNLPDEFIGKPMKLTDLSSLERAENGQTSTVQGAAGPALVQKSGPNRGQTTPLGLGSPGVATAMARPLQVADDANPGNTKIVSAGTAIKTGAAGAQSASVAVPKAAAKSEVPTKIGDQKVAFTTMIQHAQLLRQAAKALNNGDIQTLNGLQNAFKNEFGSPGPITASAIADAYKGEVSNVINKGHITDTGNEKIAHTLDPSKQNFQTIDSVLGAYQNLAQSKMNMLNKQKQSAISQSQRNGGAASQNVTPTAAAPLPSFAQWKSQQQAKQP